MLDQKPTTKECPAASQQQISAALVFCAFWVVIEFTTSVRSSMSEGSLMRFGFLDRNKSQFSRVDAFTFFIFL